MVLIDDVWIPFAHASRILKCDEKVIRRLVIEGRLTVLAVPGAYPKLVLREVEELARQSLRPRKPEFAQATV